MEKCDLTIDEFKEKVIKEDCEGFVEFFVFLAKEKIDFLFVKRKLERYKTLNQILNSWESERVFVHLKEGIVKIPMKGVSFFSLQTIDINGIGVLDEKTLMILKDTKEEKENEMIELENVAQEAVEIKKMIKIKKNNLVKKTLFISKIKKINEVEKILKKEHFLKMQTGYYIALKDGDYLYENKNGKHVLNHLTKTKINELKNNSEKTISRKQVLEKEMEKIDFIVNKNKVRMIFLGAKNNEAV